MVSEAVLLDERRPYLVGVAHASLERIGGSGIFGGFHAKAVRDARPHLAPPEHITVGRVERLIPGGGLGRRPDRVAAEQSRVSDVGDAAVLLRAAGEDERLCGGSADA